MQLSIFLTHKVIPGTFPSLRKVALGRQAIYLLLNIVITRNLSPQNRKFPLSFDILCQFSSDTILKAWVMYNKVNAKIELNCHLCAANNFYIHLATKHVL